MSCLLQISKNDILFPYFKNISQQNITLSYSTEQIMSESVKKGLKFIFLVSGVYLCFLCSAIFHQKLLKHQYNDGNGPQRFNEAIAFTLFPPFIATILGFIITSCQQRSIDIPANKSAMVGLVVNINSFTYNEAVIYASFPAVIMVKSCSLLSVILVGVFCSKVKDKKVKLGKQKIFIGIFACLGIFLFNYFGQQSQNAVDKPISYIASLFLIVSLIGDGFLPDLQSQIKVEYKPSVYDLYYHINKFTFLVCLLIGLVTFKISPIISFCQKHPQFILDMAALSVLNAVGQIFIYGLLNNFQQHIPAFVIVVRKCLTVIINILYFNHHVRQIQLLGVFLVFIAVIGQVYTNNCTKKEVKMVADEEEKTRIAGGEQIDHIMSQIDQQLKQYESQKTQNPMSEPKPQSSFQQQMDDLV